MLVQIEEFKRLRKIDDDYILRGKYISIFCLLGCILLYMTPPEATIIQVSRKDYQNHQLLIDSQLAEAEIMLNENSYSGNNEVYFSMPDKKFIQKLEKEGIGYEVFPENSFSNPEVFGLYFLAIWIIAMVLLNIVWHLNIYSDIVERGGKKLAEEEITPDPENQMMSDQ